MDFKPQHQTDPWYQGTEPLTHPGYETIEASASIFFTDLAATPASWRPHVDFKYELDVKVQVSPPDYGTFINLEDAKVWCEAVIADVRFAREVVKVHALGVSLTKDFAHLMEARRKHLPPPEDPDAAS